MSLSNDEKKYDATPLYSNSVELEKVLYALTQPNNEDLKTATMLINNFLKKPDSIMPLVQQIQSSSLLEVRQVSAVYLREQIEQYWKKVPNNTKENLKSFLIQRLLVATERPERLAIGSCISSIAKNVFIKGEWNELLVNLEKACQPDSNLQLREVAYTIWRNLLTFCGGSLKKHFSTILTILQKGLQDQQSTKVQVEAVKGIGAMVEFLENDQEVKVIENFIPNMVGVIESCLKRGDEENVISGMEVFNDLIESSIPVLRKHGVQLAQFMLRIAGARNELPLSVRKQAVNFMTWMCKTKPKTVIKNNLVQPFLQLCICLIIESQDDDEINGKKGDSNQEEVKDSPKKNDKKTKDEDEDDEKNFLTPLGIACDLLDEIFLNIPSEHCFPLAVQAIQTLLNDQDYKKRRSAYVTMAMMAEGCAEIICQGNNLPILLKASLQGLKDNNATCRKCALEAITQFSTHVQHEVIKYHKMMLPELFEIFQRPNEDIRVIETSLNAIEMFIDSIEDATEADFNVKTYLQQIMDAIALCMNKPSKELQVQAIATLSSAASSAKADFTPYLERVLQLLESLLQLKEQDMIPLRAEATGCLGAVACAVGKEKYSPVLLKFHEYVMQGFEDLDDPSIHEHTFMYFSDLANLLGPDVFKLPSFREMLDYILVIMDDDDGMMVKLPEDGFEDGVPKGLLDHMDEMEDDEDDEDDDEDANNDDDDELIDDDDNKLDEVDEETLKKMVSDFTKDEEEVEDDENEENEEDDEYIANTVGQMKTVKLAVTTGFMEEKASAIHALTYFAKYGGEEFIKYMEEAWDHVLCLWEYPHSLVKMALSHCIKAFLTLLIRKDLNLLNDEDTEPMYPWKQGDTNFEYSEDIKEWVAEIFSITIQAIGEEEDKDTLTVIIDNFNEQLKILGPAAINEHMEELCAAINLFLNEKTACQTNTDAEDEEEIMTKHRWVSDSVAELIGVLAHLWGIKFMQPFHKIYEGLLKFTKPTRHPHDQAMAIGCIADVATKLFKTGAMSKYAEKTLNIALRIAQSSETNMRQNALYCIGAIYASSNQSSILSSNSQCLRCVQTYIQLPRDGSRGDQLTRDNAVSALGKMLISESDILNLKELVPLFLNSLPLTSDLTENLHVVDCIIELIKQQIEIMQSHLPQAFTILSQALKSDDYEESSKNTITQFFKQICTNPNIQQIVNNLNNDIKNNIIQCCQN